MSGKQLPTGEAEQMMVPPYLVFEDIDIENGEGGIRLSYIPADKLADTVPALF